MPSSKEQVEKKIDRTNAVLVLNHGCLQSWLPASMPGASDRALAGEPLPSRYYLLYS